MSGGGSGGGSGSMLECTIYVSNLTPDMRTKYLQNLSCKFDKITFAEFEDPSEMATVTNEVFRGIVEVMSVEAQVEVRGERRTARVGDVLPVHVCDAKEISERNQSTQHYCDIFTEQQLAPLEELAYVRLDGHKAEKVFINRHKKILIHSSDGRVALWRCAPTFESTNEFLAGTPIVNKAGALVSVVTAKRGNHYAVSTLEGEGGSIATNVPWDVQQQLDDGNKANNAQPYVDHSCPLLPQLLVTPPSIRVIATNGATIAQTHLQAVLSTDITYL